MKRYLPFWSFFMLIALQSCNPAGWGSPHNLIDGEILAVGHGCNGFSTYRNTIPPNTIAAVDRGLAQGADGLELDVQITADGKLAVFHDGLLDRATACAGCIGDLSWAQLKDCAYQTRNGDLDGHFPIVLLDTLLAHIARSGQQPYVFVNTKHDSPCDSGNVNGAYAQFATLLVATIRRQNLGEKVIVESMSASFLQAVAAEDPSLPLLFDDEDFARGMNVVRENNFLGLCISNGQVTQAQVQQAHSEGYWLGIWGVRVSNDTRKAVEKGPELIMTDDLLMLRAALKH
jgi:glycerophosphoryl diester phosphodiesterase